MGVAKAERQRRRQKCFLRCLSLYSKQNRTFVILNIFCYNIVAKEVKRHHKVRYTNLLTNCKLNGYLADIDKQAEDMFFWLVKPDGRGKSVMEELKADNQMEWVCRMNNIRSRSIEIVNHDVIYN